jgi:hypothetical protein
MMPCTQVEMHQCFVGTYCLHFQRQRVNQARKPQGMAAGRLIQCFPPVLMAFYQITWWYIPEDHKCKDLQSDISSDLHVFRRSAHFLWLARIIRSYRMLMDVSGLRYFTIISSHDIRFSQDFLFKLSPAQLKEICMSYILNCKEH